MYQESHLKELEKEIFNSLGDNGVYQDHYSPGFCSDNPANRSLVVSQKSYNFNNQLGDSTVTAEERTDTAKTTLLTLEKTTDDEIKDYVIRALEDCALLANALELRRVNYAVAKDILKYRHLKVKVTLFEFPQNRELIEQARRLNTQRINEKKKEDALFAERKTVEEQFKQNVAYLTAKKMKELGIE